MPEIRIVTPANTNATKAQIDDCGGRSCDIRGLKFEKGLHIDFKALYHKSKGQKTDAGS